MEFKWQRTPINFNGCTHRAHSLRWRMRPHTHTQSSDRPSDAIRAFHSFSPVLYRCAPRGHIAQNDVTACTACAHDHRATPPGSRAAIITSNSLRARRSVSHLSESRANVTNRHESNPRVRASLSRGVCGKWRGKPVPDHKYMQTVYLFDPARTPIQATAWGRRGRASFCVSENVQMLGVDVASAHLRQSRFCSAIQLRWFYCIRIGIDLFIVLSPVSDENANVFNLFTHE